MGFVWDKQKTYIADVVSWNTLKQINKRYRDSVGSDVYHRQRNVAEKKAELIRRFAERSRRFARHRK